MSAAASERPSAALWNDPGRLRPGRRDHRRSDWPRLLAVQNTYLSTFQSLGGLGLLLGTFGLAAVQLRSVLERRGELALLRAAGFRRATLAAMVMLENGLLLIGGLGVGVAGGVGGRVAASVEPRRVDPLAVAGRHARPWCLLVGLLAGLAAVRAALRAPLLGALREEH